MVKVEEKYFQRSYKPAGMLLNVNAIFYSKFKLQLTFRNKNYPSIIVNFRISLR